MYERTIMLEVTAWLNTQLDADAKAARAVDVPQGTRWRAHPAQDTGPDPGRWRVASGSEVMAVATRLGAQHIANTATPHQVLADIETKQDLLALYEEYEPVNDRDPMHNLLAEIVYRFAQAYSLRPGWKDTWTQMSFDPTLSFHGWWPPRLHPV